MDELIKRYMINYNKVLELNETKPKFASGDELLDKLIERTSFKTNIIKENDEILEQIFLPLELEYNITTQQKTSLMDWSKKLLENYNNRDYGLLCRIYKILYFNAINHEDNEQIIYFLYYYALTDYCVRKVVPSFGDTNLFVLINSYVDIYDTLTDTAKIYFLKSYVNQAIFINPENVDNRLAIINFLEEKKKMNRSNNINYDQFIYSIYRNNCAMISAIRDLEEKGIKPSEKYIDMVYESALYAKKNAKIFSDGSFNNQILLEYEYDVAMFHKGELTIDELLDKFEKIMEVKPNYDVTQKTSVILEMTIQYIKYCRVYKNISLEEEYSLFYSKIDNSINFIKSLKPSDYDSFISSVVDDFVKLLITFVNYNQQERLLYSIITSRNLEGGIHTKMVASISKTIAKYLLEYNPEYFVGIDGFQSLEDVIENKEILIDTIYSMGIFHNIGTDLVNSLILIDYRSLFPSEMKIIRLHPYLGYMAVKDSLLPQTIVDGILFHHLWYDSKKGYPLGLKQSNNMPLVDIISFAGALDSETDLYSRAFNEKRGFDEYIKYAKSVAGERYNDQLVQLFNNKEFTSEIKELVTTKKQNIIIEAYKNGMLEY